MVLRNTYLMETLHLAAIGNSLTKEASGIKITVNLYCITML